MKKLFMHTLVRFQFALILTECFFYIILFPFLVILFQGFFVEDWRNNIIERIDKSIEESDKHSLW